ncbi:MAG: hypothetical protein BWY28_02406 [bacterium ADurb.Bin236]|nr:MAG: hypothetical protein BWY28_02406 [bacterium ADurb.Bin236]HPN95174.1 hypothetical protein [bacterium]
MKRVKTIYGFFIIALIFVISFFCVSHYNNRDKAFIGNEMKIDMSGIDLVKYNALEPYFHGASIYMLNSTSQPRGHIYSICVVVLYNDKLYRIFDRAFFKYGYLQMELDGKAELITSYDDNGMLSELDVVRVFAYDKELLTYMNNSLFKKSEFNKFLLEYKDNNTFTLDTSMIHEYIKLMSGNRKISFIDNNNMDIKNKYVGMNEDIIIQACLEGIARPGVWTFIVSETEGLIFKNFYIDDDGIFCKF